MLPALLNGSRGVVPANRLFDRMFNDTFFANPQAATWTMPLSVWSDEDNVYVEFDAPGLTENDVEVSIHDGILTISGERKRERQVAGYDSRTYGRFEQRVRLPAAVDFERAEAKLANGVLSLTLPQSEDAKPRKIAIRAE